MVVLRVSSVSRKLWKIVFLMFALHRQLNFLIDDRSDELTFIDSGYTVDNSMQWSIIQFFN